MKNSLEGFAGKLMAGTALAMLAATAAQAQNEQVTVTGTSIRGQVPVGANLIQVDRQSIESSGAQTTAQLLSTIPQLNNFGSAAQGGQNSSDGTGTQAPTIHSLGNSASNQTLILIDGHRLPLTGLAHNLVDPSIIPTAALASVEILPDGASAIYGSDAVAGVLNFHLRKDYSGWETSVQAGVAADYGTFNASQLFGHSWDTGGVVAAYNYSSRSNMMTLVRDYITTRQDLRLGAASPSDFPNVTAAPPANLPAGQPFLSRGGNFQNFTSCPVAVIATASQASNNAFVYPYTAANSVPRQGNGVLNQQPNYGICDTARFATQLPSEVRNAGIVGFHQQLDDRTQLTVDLVYSSRLGSSRAARGGVSNVVVFNPLGTGGPAFGSNQKNPFYVGVPGAASNANSEFVSLDLTDLLAPLGGTNTTKTGQQTVMATVNVDYDLGNDWFLTFGGTVGQDNSFARRQGALNSAEAILALNGTTKTAGTAVTSTGTSALVDPFGLSTIVNVTRALTTANALDVWNPAATNRTSQAVLRSLIDSARTQTGIQGMQNFSFKVDGTVLELPAGKIKTAIGGEYIHYTHDVYTTDNNGTGPASTSSSTFFLRNIHRTVYAAFAEFVVPVVSPDMGIPLIQKLEFDFAGRYDNYSDFGDTVNPKISFGWDIIDGLRASASMSSSFTAPALSSVGGPGTGTTAESSVDAYTNAGGQPNLGLGSGVIPFNTTAPFNGGAGIAGTWVSTAASCAAAGSRPVDITGAVVAAPYTTAVACSVNAAANASTGLSLGSGGSPLNKPQIGQSYSANLVFDFGKFWDALDGLNFHLTYYEAKIVGAVTSIGVQANIPSRTTYGPIASASNPTGGWADSDPVVQNLISLAPLSVPVPSRIWIIFDGRQTNAYTLWQNGLDFSLDYRMSTDDYGDFTFSVAGNQILRFTQQAGPGAAVLEIKNGQNNGRFTGIESTGRASIGWRLDPFNAGISFNYQHSYNQPLTTFPNNFTAYSYEFSTSHGLVPGNNGIYRVPTLFTIDVNASYDLPDEWLSGTSVNLNINNILDTDPPFFNNSSGSQGGSAIGRMVTVGVRKKW
jgi:iron complex outermembrane receptor protein